MLNSHQSRKFAKFSRIRQGLTEDRRRRFPYLVDFELSASSRSRRLSQNRHSMKSPSQVTNLRPRFSESWLVQIRRPARGVNRRRPQAPTDIPTSVTPKIAAFQKPRFSVPGACPATRRPKSQDGLVPSLEA